MDSTKPANTGNYRETANPTASTPSDTDSEIKDFNSPHQSWLPRKPARNQLLVFLPGTHGIPKSNSPFAQTAASMGYHVISLIYPDSVAAQQVCARKANPQAYLNFRLEIIEGGEHSQLIQVSRADSIENRLIKLLEYLDAHQPNQGWKQFLTDKQVNWEKIAISGHSQGGGHAYVIAKLHKVARVIMFGSPKDYSHYFHAPAAEFDSGSETPLNRYFAFNHLKDSLAGCNHDQQMEIFQQMGLTKLGTANADASSTAFNHAHMLFTDLQLPQTAAMPAIHTSVLNNTSAKNKDGQPLCPAVWRYMLSEPTN